MRSGAVCQEHQVPMAQVSRPAVPLPQTRLHKQFSCTTGLARSGELGWKVLLPMAV